MEQVKSIESLKEREELEQEYRKEANKLYRAFLDALEFARAASGEIQERAERAFQDALTPLREAYKKGDISLEEYRAEDQRFHLRYRGAMRSAHTVYIEADSRARKTYNEAIAPLRQAYKKALREIDRKIRRRESWNS